MQNLTSQSIFVEYPKRVVFCQNDSDNNIMTTCNESHSVTVYAGDIFTVQLMAADNQCFPSAELIQAKVVWQSASLWNMAPLEKEKNIAVNLTIP